MNTHKDVSVSLPMLDICQRTGKYVDARAHNTQASYDEYVARFLAQNLEIQSHEQILDSIKIELWAKAAEGQQRPDRVYGLGALAGNVVHGNLFRAPVLPESSSARSAELSPDMQTMITRMNEEELQSQKLVLQNQNELLESQKQALEAQNKALARKDERGEANERNEFLSKIPKGDDKEVH